MKKVLMILLIVVVGLAMFISNRPGQFHVERSTTIEAPAAVLFPRIADLHGWAAWSPWEKRDLQMKKTFSGAEAGVGAVYDWSGNDKVGSGRMTVAELTPDSRIEITVEFFKPFAATSSCIFTLAPEGSGTKVTWAMEGKEDFMGKAMGLFMNMDKMIGGDFEEGLANLKRVAEAGAPSPAGTDSSQAAGASDATHS